MIGFGGMVGAVASAFCAPPRPAQTISDGPVSGPWSKQPWIIEKPVDVPMDKVPRGDGPVDDPWGRQQPYDGPLRDGSDTKPKIITAQEAEDTGLIYWTTVTEFDGKIVYQRDDLIDPNVKDPNGITNLELMRSGRSPLGPDQKPIILHHMLQTNDSPIAELSSTFNDRYRRIIHVNPRTIPSGIDREQFDVWRREYWRERANEIVERRQKYQ